MRLTTRKLALAAVTAALCAPTTAGAMVPRDYSPATAGGQSALVCGKDYSRNSVDGSFCVRAADNRVPVAVSHDGFSWGDAAAGAAVASALALIAFGTTAVVRRRRISAAGGTRHTPATG